MLLLLSKWPSLRLHLSPPGIHKFSVFPLLQTLHGSLGISTQLLSLACGAPHSGVLTPSLASFPVAVPHVVATWVNQLTLSLQAFACSVSPVQSCIMNTLIFPWASSCRTRSFFQEAFPCPSPRWVWCLFWTHRALCS